MERGVFTIFGLKTYGCHINGYIKKDGNYLMWIARRAKTKQTYPGMLDNFAGGGLSSGLNPTECAKKELEEEAFVPKEISFNIKSVEVVSYAYICGEGLLKRESHFVFDLKLPLDFKPFPKDGEAESFYLMSIDEVISLNNYAFLKIC